MGETIAFIAGALSILSTGPQIIKIAITNRAKDLSLTTYIMLSAAGFLWVFYGIVEESNSILFWNSIGTLLSLLIVFIKLSEQYKIFKK
jgi:uncharacterized protein with PQ loop repeat